MLLASCIWLTNCFPLSNLVVFLFVHVYSERRKSLTGPITVCMLANLVQNVKTCMLGNQLKITFIRLIAILSLKAIWFSLCYSGLGLQQS